MLRLYCDADRQVAVTVGNHRTGRGAYCCPHPDCMEKTIKKHLYAKSLRIAANIPESDKLLRSMNAAAKALNHQRGDSEHGENHG